MIVVNGPEYPDEDIASAYHEAGHAVAVIHGGFKFLGQGISIRGPGGSATTHWTSGDIEQRARHAEPAQSRFNALRPKLIVDFAGGYAEVKKTGNGGAANAGVIDDMKLARESFMCVVGPWTMPMRSTWMQKADEEARAMIDENWTAVTAIAEALLSQTILSGNEAETLYATARQSLQEPVIEPAVRPGSSAVSGKTPVAEGQVSLVRWLRRLFGIG